MQYAWCLELIEVMQIKTSTKRQKPTSPQAHRAISTGDINTCVASVTNAANRQLSGLIALQLIEG